MKKNLSLLCLLNQPQLVEAIRGLEPAALGRLLQEVGLEDSAEIIALATTDQLKRVFDEDLWRNDRPGRAETFDAARFAVWLEVLSEMGPAALAERLFEMDRDFLCSAYASLLVVVNLDEMILQGRSFDDLGEKAMASTFSHEFEGYLVLSRHPESWDAVVESLLALDTHHNATLLSVLDRCARASASCLEESGGLHRVLSLQEELEQDVAQGREERRRKEGYVEARSAAHFLTLARESLDEDPITREYFRTFSHREESSDLTDRLKGTVLPVPVPRADRYSRVRRNLSSRGLAELRYLANVLVAGCSYRDRRFRPTEAAEAAIATCNLGLEKSEGETSLVRAFKVGWQRLYREVSLPAAERLLARIKDLKDREVSWLYADLKRQKEAGKPWASRKRLPGLLRFFDGKEVGTWLALLDEFPSPPAEGEFFSELSPHGPPFRVD